MRKNSDSNISEIGRRKFIRSSAMATAAFALSPFLPACKTRGKKPNIVYLFADQWRGSATGYGGDPNVKTPNLDRLAEESINFSNTVSVCPVCTPYRAGDDLSSLICEGGEKEDRSSLYMSVSPFNYGQGAYRSIRTKRYTYVRNLEGPWLMFDDRNDPWQMNNLIGKAGYEEIGRDLDAKLHAQLKKIGDDFRSPHSYIEEWGLEVDPDRGAVIYKDFDQEPQKPERHITG